MVLGAAAPVPRRRRARRRPATEVGPGRIERFVLVGHSMGGLTISEIAGRVPDRIEHLVYVSCMVPPEGESAIDALPEDLRDMTREAVEEARRGGANPNG